MPDKLNTNRTVNSKDQAGDLLRIALSKFGSSYEKWNSANGVSNVGTKDEVNEYNIFRRGNMVGRGPGNVSSLEYSHKVKNERATPIKVGKGGGGNNTGYPEGRA